MIDLILRRMSWPHYTSPKSMTAMGHNDNRWSSFSPISSSAFMKGQSGCSALIPVAGNDSIPVLDRISHPCYTSDKSTKAMGHNGWSYFSLRILCAENSSYLEPRDYLQVHWLLWGVWKACSDPLTDAMTHPSYTSTKSINITLTCMSHNWWPYGSLSIVFVSVSENSKFLDSELVFLATLSCSKWPTWPTAL